MKKRGYHQQVRDRMTAVKSRYRTVVRRTGNERVVTGMPRIPAIYGRYVLSERGAVKGRKYEWLRELRTGSHCFFVIDTVPLMTYITAEAYKQRRRERMYGSVFFQTTRNEWWIV